MKPFAVMLAVGLLFAAPVHAQTGRTYTMLGHGVSTCGSWTSDLKEGSVTSRYDKVWLQGYLSAFNNYGSYPGGDVTAGVDADGLFAWMDNYCAAHPLDKIAKGAASLIDELRARRR